MNPCRSLIGVFILASTAVSALASGLEAEIPFAFRAGDRELPAGTYTFAVDESNSNVRVRGGKTDVRLQVKTRLRGPTAKPDFEGMLGFDRKDNVRVLSEIWVGGGGGYLVGNLEGAHAHVEVAVVSRPPEGFSGKKIFAQTCQVCHGRDGRGEPKAEVYYGRKLPRLDSDFVQGKSDEELREIITVGRKAMDPVRMQDDSGARHTLPSYAVNPLIAYVRTLKSSR